MSCSISVVIPSHNSRNDYLQATLKALQGQTLPRDDWEIVVVDNMSAVPVATTVDLGWHFRGRIVREEQLGLTRARLRGFAETSGDVVVFVDDDNVLTPEYLEVVRRTSQVMPFLGAWGGSIRARYEDESLAPPTSLLPLLTVRDAQVDLWSNDVGHHASTPWGAGLCVRRAVADAYQSELAACPSRAQLDLQGRRLLYGGDTDIVYTACRIGMGKGVFVNLALEHLIPSSRCTREYLCRVAEGRGYSEILHQYLLDERLPPADSIGATLRRIAKSWRANALERAVMSSHQNGRESARLELQRA